MWVNVNKLRDEMIKYFARYDHMAAPRALGRSKFKIHFQNKKLYDVLLRVASHLVWHTKKSRSCGKKQEWWWDGYDMWYAFLCFLLSSIVLPQPKNQSSTLDVQNYTKSAS